MLPDVRRCALASEFSPALIDDPAAPHDVVMKHPYGTVWGPAVCAGMARTWGTSSARGEQSVPTVSRMLRSPSPQELAPE